jgi:hypothetical protein
MFRQAVEVNGDGAPPVLTPPALVAVHVRLQRAMSLDRKLVIGGVALVKARLRNTGPALAQVAHELAQVLIESNWFPKAPFDWVGLIVRYGLKTESTSHFQRINKTHGCLPLAVEVDTNLLLDLHRDPTALKAFLKAVTLDCLLSVGRRYDLPVDALEVERQSLLKAQRH